MLASCSVSSGGTSPTPSAGTFVVTSEDFEDGGGIPAVNTATAFDGQCTGEDDLARAIQGRNDNGTLGYFGPCPPGPSHHYVVTVYALDQALDLESGYAYDDFLKASIGHPLATATLTGTRSGPA